MDVGERKTICSFYHEPDLLIGCTGENYTAQLENYGQYNPQYDPLFVNYALLFRGSFAVRLFIMADSLLEIAAAMEETGKKSRYGSPTAIACKYERYMKGVYYYVLNQISLGEIQKKTVAITPKYNALTKLWELPPFVGRLAQYCADITDNLYTQYGGNGTNTVTLTTEMLLRADVIIAEDDSLRVALEEQDLVYNGILIDAMPVCTFGMTYNSHENAMGIPLLAGCIYNDQDAQLNPVHFIAYFLEEFYHIKDEFLQAELDALLAPVRYLPVGTNLNLDDAAPFYSPAAVEALLDKGLQVQRSV